MTIEVPRHKGRRIHLKKEDLAIKVIDTRGGG
jgi:hypothetical protein